VDKRTIKAKMQRCVTLYLMDMLAAGLFVDAKVQILLDIVSGEVDGF
jgi:hypothetical protein